MSETKQPTNFKYEWETNQIIKIDYIKRRSLYHPRLTYIQNSGDITYCTEDEKDIKCDVLISRQAQEIKRLREENEENEKNLINEEQKYMGALGEIDNLKKRDEDLTQLLIKKDNKIIKMYRGEFKEFEQLEKENKKLKLELSGHKRNKKKKKKNSLYIFQEQELKRKTHNLNERLKILENENKKLRKAGNMNNSLSPHIIEIEYMSSNTEYSIKKFSIPRLIQDLEKGKLGEIHELRLSETCLDHMDMLNMTTVKKSTKDKKYHNFSGFSIHNESYVILHTDQIHGILKERMEAYTKNKNMLTNWLNLTIKTNNLEQTNKDLLNKINEHKPNNKKMKKDINELSKELTKSYIKIDELKEEIKTNKDYKEYKDNFEKLQTQSGEQLKNVINDYEKDLKILRMRIKDQDNTLNTQGTRLKELANMKNQYSKYIDKYNRIDKYIDNTIYRITGIKRDFKKGIHNNINSLNQLRNIDEIIKQDLNITKSEFNNYFKNIKNLRLQQAHEDISHITSQDLINMILEDMIF